MVNKVVACTCMSLRSISTDALVQDAAIGLTIIPFKFPIKAKGYVNCRFRSCG